MLSVLADENFSHRILRGIKLRAGNVDVLIAQNAQESVFWMNPATKLIPETASRKERDANLPGLKDPAFPGKPHIEVEDPGRVGQRNHHFALHGHAVTVNFAIEGFAEGDCVRVVAAAIGEPNVKLIKKVKSSPIDQTIAPGLFLGAEENRRSEDALKPLRDATVIATIFRFAAESRLGVSQSYLAMLESGSRRLPRKSVRRFSKTYGLAPTSLPLPTNLKPSEETAEALAAELAALGCEGFAHLRPCRRQKNPGQVLLTALAQPKLEARLFEALPWLMVQHSDMPFDWLVQQAKLLDLQNLLGFVTTLAREVVIRQAPNQTDRIEALRKLEDALENSKLAKVEPLGKLSVGQREAVAEGESL
jgi:hypothetical protein